MTGHISRSRRNRKSRCSRGRNPCFPLLFLLGFLGLSKRSNSTILSRDIWTPPELKMYLSVRASNMFSVFTGARAKDKNPPAGLMLRSPGGAAGAPAAPGHEGGHAGWAGCAAAIQGGVATSACGNQVAAGGQPGSASAAAHSEPAAQFQSAPLAPTCCQPWSSTSEIFPLPLP